MSLFSESRNQPFPQQRRMVIRQWHLNRRTTPRRQRTDEKIARVITRRWGYLLLVRQRQQAEGRGNQVNSRQIRPLPRPNRMPVKRSCGTNRPRIVKPFIKRNDHPSGGPQGLGRRRIHELHRHPLAGIPRDNHSPAPCS